jgi:hypothetical protein
MMVFNTLSFIFSQKDISLFQRLFNGDETDPRVKKYMCKRHADLDIQIHHPIYILNLRSKLLELFC